MSSATEHSGAMPEPGWKRIFVGPQGARPGWRLLIFFALLGFMLGATWPLRRLNSLLLQGFPELSQVIDTGIRFAAAVAATVLAGSLENRGLSDYGLPFRRMLGKQFWTGALWGFLMISLIIAILEWGHVYSPGTLALAPLGIVKYGLLWAAVFLIWGLHYEFSYRGYLQFTLSSGLGFWPAAAITSAAFAVVTLSHWSQFGVYFLVSFFLCVALRHTGNLWFGIGWDTGLFWGLFFVYSIPDTTGSYNTGHLLNASLLNPSWLYALAAFAVLGGVLLAKLYPAVKYPAAAPTPAGQAELEPPGLALTAPPSFAGEQSHEPVAAPVATRKHLLRRIFIGAQGMRAGWRMLIFLVLAGVMYVAYGPLQDRIEDRLPSGLSPAGTLVAFAPVLAILLIAASIMGRFERRSRADYGLPIRRMLGKQFWTGALWGFVMFSIVVFMLAVVHNYVPGTPALSPLQAVEYACLWAFASLVQASCVEFFFRGYLQFTLTGGLGFWPAAAILGLLDAVVSRGHWGDIGFYAFMAFLMSMALRHTGNLWFSIGWNTAYLWSWNFFYSFPNQGGRATGHLLHSRMNFRFVHLFTVIVIYAAVVLLAKTYPEVKYAAAIPPADSEAKPDPDVSALAVGEC